MVLKAAGGGSVAAFALRWLHRAVAAAGVALCLYQAHTCLRRWAPGPTRPDQRLLYTTEVPPLGLVLCPTWVSNREGNAADVARLGLAGHNEYFSYQAGAGVPVDWAGNGTADPDEIADDILNYKVEYWDLTFTSSQIFFLFFQNLFFREFVDSIEFHVIKEGRMPSPIEMRAVDLEWNLKPTVTSRNSLSNIFILFCQRSRGTGPASRWSPRPRCRAGASWSWWPGPRPRPTPS